jgi:hypothetical protein
LCILLAAALAARAQTPSVGVIDFYGLRKATEAQVRSALQLREGDPLPKSKGDVEESLESVRNVVRARLEAVCCQEGKAILYVGVEERGAPHFDYNPAPSGDVRVPEEVHLVYAQFLGAVNRAARSSETTESLSEGHSLLSDPVSREYQLRFVPLADKHFAMLKDALRNSSEAEHRAMAAYVLGYTRNKRAVVADLQAALRDPDDTVRNNAMRALGAIAVLAALQRPGIDPEDRITVQPTWFVEMLDSLIWTDRQTALNVLVTLTERRDASVVSHLRERSLPSLVEMARWKHLAHALPAFILVGRIGGLPENAIETAWSGGRREEVIKQVLQSRGAATRPNR